MKAEIKNGNLILTIPMNVPRPSTSGKSLIVASTSGFTETEAEVDGKKVKVSVNACIAKAA